MSYGLARKVFNCTSCVPHREIKMLVGADVEQVVCDKCRSHAFCNDKPLPPVASN